MNPRPLAERALDTRTQAERRRDEIAARNRAMREIRRTLGESSWRPMGPDRRLREPRRL